MTPMRSRRAWLRTAAGLLVTTLPRLVRAAAVPAGIQAQLVAKVAAYDRNFVARAGALARVLVVHRSGDVESTRFAGLIAKALGDLSEIATRPKQIDLATFVGAAAIAARCGPGKAAILYLAPGLEDEVPAVAKALEGGDVLSFGASRDHAVKGAVVGFGLEESKPKLVVNLARAKLQNVAFKADLLKLAQLV